MSTLFVTILLVAVSGVLTGAATALRSVNRIWLRHWAERRLAGAGTAQLYLDRPQRLLLAASTGVAGTVFALGAMIGLQVGDRPGSLTQSLVLSAVLLLIFGQLIPRAVGRRWPAETLPWLLPPLRAVERLIAPLALLANRIVRLNRSAEERTPE